MHACDLGEFQQIRFRMREAGGATPTYLAVSGGGAGAATAAAENWVPRGRDVACAHAQDVGTGDGEEDAADGHPRP